MRLRAPPHNIPPADNKWVDRDRPPGPGRTPLQNDLGFYFLLLSRFQITGVLRLFAHALHGIHHIVLLGQKRVA